MKYMVTIELKVEGELSEVKEDIERMAFGMFNFEGAQVCKLTERGSYELIGTYYNDGTWDMDDEEQNQ